MFITDGELTFPTKLLKYGLNEEMLSTVFKQVSNGETARVVSADAGCDTYH